MNYYVQVKLKENEQAKQKDQNIYIKNSWLTMYLG